MGSRIDAFAYAVATFFVLSSHAESLPKPAAPIPPGFGWPAPGKTLVDWTQQQRIALMRDHAWKLWAGINQPAGSGKTVYETWWPVTATLHLRDPATVPRPSLKQINILNIGAGVQNGDPNCKAGAQQLTNVPCYGDPKTSCQGNCLDANGNVRDGVRYANNGDIMIAGEYYNQEAWQHIRDGKLWLKANLDPKGQQYSSIATFPNKAVVLKYMGWPARGDGLTALPIWDGAPTQAYWNYNGFETWKRAVAIDPRAGPIASGKTASVTYLYNVGNYKPVTFPDAKVVPVSAFYHRKVGKAEWDAMDPGDKCILNQSANWAYNRNFQPGDYIVTIAMHIITKEMPDWAMQTFWWHDRPDEGPFAENRPASLPAGQWRNYLMTTAWSMVTPHEFDGSPYVAMNPYIELVIPELCRMTTNCQNCHTRAAYPTRSTSVPYGATYDTSVRGHIAPKDPIFEKLRKTDFQWALPDRAH